MKKTFTQRATIFGGKVIKGLEVTGSYAAKKFTQYKEYSKKREDEKRERYLKDLEYRAKVEKQKAQIRHYAPKTSTIKPMSVRDWL